jgi:hypothetical protein
MPGAVRGGRWIDRHPANRIARRRGRLGWVMALAGQSRGRSHKTVLTQWQTFLHGKVTRRYLAELERVPWVSINLI